MSALNNEELIELLLLAHERVLQSDRTGLEYTEDLWSDLLTACKGDIAKRMVRPDLRPMGNENTESLDDFDNFTVSDLRRWLGRQLCTT